MRVRDYVTGRVLAYILIALIGALIHGRAHASYYWTQGNFQNVGPSSSPGALCALMADKNGSYFTPRASYAPHPEPINAERWSCKAQVTNNGYGESFACCDDLGEMIRHGEPDQCTAYQSGDTLTASNHTGDNIDTFCTDNCLFTFEAGFPSFGNVIYSTMAATCEAGQPGTNDAPPGTGNKNMPLTADTGIGTAQLDKQQAGGAPNLSQTACITMTATGEKKCLGQGATTGTCTRLSNGSGFCTAASPAIQPKNPDGTTKAPAGSIAVTDALSGAAGGGTTTNTYNSYSSTSFSTSTNYGTGQNTGTGTGTGTGNTGTGSTGTGSSSGNGNGNGSGGGNGAFSGPGGTARSFADSAAVVRGAFTSSPLGQAIGGIHLPSGPGSCPTANISIPYLHTSATMDSHCQLAEQVKPLLRAMFLLCWAIFAVMLFLRP